MVNKVVEAFRNNTLLLVLFAIVVLVIFYLFLANLSNFINGITIIISKNQGFFLLLIIIILVFYIIKTKKEEFSLRDPLEVLEAIMDKTRYFKERGIMYNTIKRETLYFWQRERGGLVIYSFKAKDTSDEQVYDIHMVAYYNYNVETLVAVNSKPFTNVEEKTMLKFYEYLQEEKQGVL